MSRKFMKCKKINKYILGMCSVLILIIIDVNSFQFHESNIPNAAIFFFFALQNFCYRRVVVPSYII